MTKLFCQICGESLKVDAEQIPGSQPVKIRCPGCQGVFLYERLTGNEGEPLEAGSVVEVVRDELFAMDIPDFWKLLHSQVFWLILVLAGMPLILNMLNVEIVRGMTVYFSMIWFLVFIKLFQYEETNIQLHLGVYFLSLLTLSPVFSLVNSLTSPFYSFIDSDSAFLRFTGFFCGVGVTEELTKAMPILFLAIINKWKGQVLSGREYLLCGIMSGLAFAGVENFGYIQMAVIRDTFMGTVGDGAVTSLVRSTLTPFIHACLSGIFAYFIGLYSLYPSRSPWTYILSGLFVSSLLHAIYDFAVTVSFFSQAFSFLALALMYMGLLVCWLNLKTRAQRVAREGVDNYIQDIF